MCRNAQVIVIQFFWVLHDLNKNDTHWISGSLLFKSFLPPVYQWDFVSQHANSHSSGAPHLLLFVDETLVCLCRYTSVSLPVAVVMPFCARICLYKYIYIYIYGNRPSCDLPFAASKCCTQYLQYFEYIEYFKYFKYLQYFKYFKSFKYLNYFRYFEYFKYFEYF